MAAGPAVNGTVPSSPFGFIADAAGVVTVALRQQDRLDAMGVHPSTSAGVDLLTDDGMPVQKAADLMVAAQRLWEREGGPDPEAQARHIITLRRALSSDVPR